MNDLINKLLGKIMADIEPSIFMIQELSKQNINTLNSYENVDGVKIIGEEEKQEMIEREKLKIQAVIKWYMNDLVDKLNFK